MSFFTILILTGILVAFEIMIGIKLPWLRKFLTKYPFMCVPFSIFLGLGISTAFHAGGVTLMIPSLANIVIMSLIYKHWDDLIAFGNKVKSKYDKTVENYNKTKAVCQRTGSYIQDVADVLSRKKTPNP